MLPKSLRRVIMGKRRLQPLWERVYRISLSGMNIGDFADVFDSGEGLVLDHVDRELRTPRPFVIFDVGANVGNYARLALSKFGGRLDLYCFEPSSKTFELLLANLKGYPMVEFFNIGFGKDNQELDLYSDGYGSGMASVYPRRLYNKGGRPLERVETIHLCRLDDFCNERNIKHIHLLKMDVEGHEMMVLEGARELLRSDSVDFIQFEFGACNVDSRTYLRDFYNLLCEEFGYELYRIVKDGLFKIDTYHETFERFYMTNYLAARRNQ